MKLLFDFKLLEKLLNPIKIYNLYHFRPIPGFSFDSRTIKPGEGFIAIKGKYQDGHDYVKAAIKQGAGAIIAQQEIIPRPKVPVYIVDDTYQALASLARYIRIKKNPLVYAITGSVGKTTTKEMLYFLLADKFKVLKNNKTENNILGVGKTILALNDENILILELGTNNPGEIKTLADMAYPDVGIVTFVKPVHLEGLGSLEGILEEKISLLRVNSKIKAILNRDDEYLGKACLTNKTYWFGKDKKSDIYGCLLNSDFTTSSFLIQNKYKLSLPTPFTGFIYNALAAMLAAKLSGISLDNLVSKMNNFNDFPAMRMQREQIGNLSILNDAYNANPYSFSETLKVIAKYPDKKIAVIGDMRELGKDSVYYHECLASDINKSGFDYVLATGELSVHTIKKLKQLGHNNALHFNSTDLIAEFIIKKIKKPYLVFLKGSRGMALEKIIEYLRDKISITAPTNTFKKARNNLP